MAKKGSQNRGGLAYSPNSKGLFGFTPNQMRAQIANLGATPTGATKRVAADQSAAIAKYGSALSPSIRKQFVVARAAQQQDAVAVLAGKEQIAAGEKTLGDIATIFKGGAAAQAAAYARQSALDMQQQSGASDAQTAAFMQQIFMAKQAHQWAVQDAAKAQAAALGAAADQTKGIVAGVMSSAGTITSGIQTAYMTAKDTTEAGVAPTANEIFTTWFAGSTYAEGSQEALFARQLANQVANNGGDIVGAVEAAIPATFGGYAGFDSGMVSTATIKQATANTVATRLAYVEQNPNGRVADYQGGQPTDTPEHSSFGAATGSGTSTQAQTDAFWNRFRADHPGLYS